MPSRPGLLSRAPKTDDWCTPWQFCKNCDDDDREKRRAAVEAGCKDDFDGSRPYDSPIVYWSRRVQRYLDALTPWSRVVHLCTKKLCGPAVAPTWMWRQRGRYYAEDYYVLLMTVFVTFWACLTIGLTRPSSWHAASPSWVLLVPGVLLLPLYVLTSNHWPIVFLACGVPLAAAAVLPAIFGLGDWVRWAVPWPLALRAAEILLTLARFINFDTLPGGYMHTPISRLRYLCYTILYVVQICFIYATIYAFWVPGGFHDPSGCASGAIGNCATVTGLNEHLYLSVTTITTLGGGFQPSSGLAQWLQISEIAIGVLLLAVGLATFVGSMRLNLAQSEPRSDFERHRSAVSNRPGSQGNTTRLRNGLVNTPHVQLPR